MPLVRMLSDWVIDGEPAKINEDKVVTASQAAALLALRKAVLWSSRATLQGGEVSRRALAAKPCCGQ